jgi:hypothetical protein
LGCTSYNGKEVNIPLLKNKMGASTTDKVIGSVQNLEYSIADALKQSHYRQSKTIARLRSELQDVFHG